MSKTLRYSFAGFALYFGIFLIFRLYTGVIPASLLLLMTLSAILVFLALTIFTIWGSFAFLVSFISRRPMRAPAKVVGKIAVSGVSMFAVFMLLGKMLPEHLPGGSYDDLYEHAAWLDPVSENYKSKDLTPRQKMLADVVSKFQGKNRDQLVEMLGPSSEINYFQDKSPDLIYMTGPERGSFIALDSEWLLIWLDDKGFFKHYAIYHD